MIKSIRCGISIPFSALLILSTSCTNISNLSTAGVNGGGILNDTGSTGNGNAFILSSLAPDPTTPGSVIDYIGTQEQFDYYCSLGQCMCQFTYTDASGNSETVAENVTYQEADLITCNNMIPSGITTFSTEIIVVPSTSASPSANASPTPASNAPLYNSNSIQGNFGTNGNLAGSTIYQNLSSASAYVPVQRFQCRKRAFIPNPMNPSMVDPFQSQNPAVIYAFNYYTTNVGATLLSQQQSSDASWECSLTATADYSVQWWANPVVFSSSPCTDSFCSGDGSLIYPTGTLAPGKIPVNNPNATGKKRSSFYLASQAYDVFNVAVVAAVAPSPSSGNTTATAASPAPAGTYNAATYGTIGYAARPIPGSAGNTSTCPTPTGGLPPNAYWVKLWNFGASIPAPVIVTGSTAIAESAIVCDSTHGDVTGNIIGSQIFPSCEMNDLGWHTNTGNASFQAVGQGGAGRGVFGVSLDDPRVASGAALASRVASIINNTGTENPSACYNFGTGTGVNSNSVGSIPWYTTNPATAPYLGGTDTWSPSPYALDNTVGLATITGFPWNLYSAAQINVTNGSWTYGPHNGTSPYNEYLYLTATGGGEISLPSGTPSDTSVTTSPLSPDPFIDQLFVVTDPSVQDSQFTSNGVPPEYQPVTYQNSSVCPGPAPCNPSTTGNNITWLLNTTQVGTVQGQGATVYPLCVLQFYD